MVAAPSGLIPDFDFRCHVNVEAVLMFESTPPLLAVTDPVAIRYVLLWII